MPDIRLSKRAAADLDEIADYFARENPRAGVRLFKGIEDATRMLNKHPYLGAENKRDRSLHSWLLAGFPYRIHYTIEAGDLVIIHIRHTARRPWQGEGE